MRSQELVVYNHDNFICGWTLNVVNQVPLVCVGASIVGLKHHKIEALWRVVIADPSWSLPAIVECAWKTDWLAKYLHDWVLWLPNAWNAEMHAQESNVDAGKLESWKAAVVSPAVCSTTWSCSEPTVHDLWRRVIQLLFFGHNNVCPLKRGTIIHAVELSIFCCYGTNCIKLIWLVLGLCLRLTLIFGWPPLLHCQPSWL